MILYSELDHVSYGVARCNDIPIIYEARRSRNQIRFTRRSRRSHRNMSCSKCTELRYNRTRILPDLWSKRQSGQCRPSHFHPNRAAAVDLSLPTVLEWNPSAYCQKMTIRPTRSAVQPGMGYVQSKHWIQDRALRAKRVDQFELG